MKSTEYTTSDLATAAYLLMKGKQLLSASRHQSGKFNFVFADDDGKCPQMAIEFLGTEFCTYDSHLRNLKKLVSTF